MSLDPAHMSGESRPPRSVSPINVPGIVLALIVIFAGIHWVRTSWLSPENDVWTLVNFALIPDCYSDLDQICALREPWAGLVSPLSHAFLHGDWTHFATNAIWLLAFGTPVARRLGMGGFLIFSAIGAIAGAALFYMLNPTLIQPMIGASGIVSALMGGAARFALGSMGRLQSSDVIAPFCSSSSSSSRRISCSALRAGRSSARPAPSPGKPMSAASCSAFWVSRCSIAASTLGRSDSRPARTRRLPAHLSRRRMHSRWKGRSK